MTDAELGVAEGSRFNAGSDSAEPIIQLRGLTRRFGTFTAVDSIDLTINRGELFGLLGASGCGKSTLLRMIAGFELPDSGSVTIDGVDMAGAPPYERPVNIMFQSYALFPHMSVEKNVAYGLKRDRVARGEIAHRVAQMLSMVELSDFARRKPHQLSGGQRQRVALARALVKQPKVLLLDEPLAALDRRLREQTQFELMNIQHALGITFIVVTHDQEEAMTLCSRMAVMDAGRFLQIGEPAHIYENPASRYVANFIGSANLIDGIVEARDRDGVITVRHSGGQVFRGVDNLHAPDGASKRVGTELSAIGVGDSVSLAVRPEKISLLQADAVDRAQQHNLVEGSVDEIAYLGRLSVYKVDTGLKQPFEVSVANLSRNQSALPMLRRGDAVTLSWDAASSIVLTE